MVARNTSTGDSLKFWAHVKGELGMSVGIRHAVPYRAGAAAQVARHWAERGCPVVIHVDKRVRKAAYDRLAADLADLPNVRFSAATPANGAPGARFAATQAAAEVMLRDFPEVRHVYLASGSCLPLRPVRSCKPIWTTARAPISSKA
jgi:hypothetical protein